MQSADIARGSTNDTSGTLTGTLVGRDDNQPVPYGTVLLVGMGDARFADADGHFRIARLAPGTYQLRARQIGYAPTDTTLLVDPGPAVTTIAIRLARLPSLLGLVKVEGHRSPGCVATGAPDSAVDPALATILAQVNENVDRFRLLWEQYPFRYTREEHTGILLEPGGYDSQHEETASYESRSQRLYRVGAVVYQERDEAGQSRRVMYIPTFRDLADSAFLAAHCFSYGGAQRLDGKPSVRVLRLDFKPANTIATPDVEGSVYLDADRLLVRRAVFRLTKPESLEPPVVSVTVTSTYRELMPFVPVLDVARTVQPLPQSGEVTRTAITEDRLTDYRFEDRKPGDQSTTMHPAADVVSASPVPDRTASIEGRVVRPDARPVRGASVGLLGSTDSAATNDNGHFILRHTAPGPRILWVHGIGFEPVRVAVTLAAGQSRTLAITVAQMIATLPTVVTTAPYPAEYSKVGLDRRIQAGVGTFITLDQIAKRQASTVTQLLQNVRGIHLYANTGGLARDPGVRVESSQGDCVGFMLDGVPQETFRPSDLDQMFTPDQIGAIEIYSPASKPVGFGSETRGALGETCTVVAIWTRSELGLTGRDSVTADSGTQATTHSAAMTRAPRTTGTADFPAESGGACQPSAAIDTTTLDVYAILQSELGVDSHDTTWISYADGVFSAFREAFALPTPLPLPVFGYATPAISKSSLGAGGLAVAPALSSVVTFTLDPTGSVLASSVVATSLSGAADTSILATIQTAAASHAFPSMPAGTYSPPSVRFDVIVTTTAPDATQRAIVVDQIAVPEWSLSQAVALAPGGQPVFSSTRTNASTPPDSAIFEFVVDETGHAVTSTARANSRASHLSSPAYLAFVARVGRMLDAYHFDPAVIGSCRVRQVTSQLFTN